MVHGVILQLSLCLVLEMVCKLASFMKNDEITKEIIKQRKGRPRKSKERIEKKPTGRPPKIMAELAASSDKQEEAAKKLQRVALTFL